MAASNLIQFGQKHVAKGLGRLTNNVISKGKGSYLFMADGKKYLDFTTGIGVAGLGELCILKIISLYNNFIF